MGIYMKAKVAIGMALMAVMSAVALSACGSAAKYSAGGTASTTYESVSDMAASEKGFYAEAPAEETAESAEFDEAAEYEEGSVDVPEDALAGRKLIKNVNLSVETEQFDVLVPHITQRVNALGGYIEEMSSYSRNETYSSDYRGTKYLRYASMTARIPKDRLDAFVEEVGEQSNVVSHSENVTDVTLQYVDLESHKKALSTEQDRLLELLGQAENVEDIIAIEGRLSEVRYQIESMESQLRTFDNQIDYSTVYIYIDEVERYSPPAEATVFERIRRGFVDSLWGIGKDAGDCAVWFLINIPYIAVWAVIVIVAALVIRKLYQRFVERRKRKKEASKGTRNPYPGGPMQWNHLGRARDRGRRQDDREAPGQYKGEDVMPEGHETDKEGLQQDKTEKESD